MTADCQGKCCGKCRHSGNGHSDEPLFELYVCSRCHRMKREPIGAPPPERCRYISYPVRARLIAEYGGEDVIPPSALAEAECGGNMRVMQDADKIREALAWR